MSEEKPTKKSIIEGTVAQVLGGSLASTVVLGLASAKVYLAAGFESAFGTLLSVVFYIAFKWMRRQ